MIVAEELGIRYEDVCLEFDTKAAFTPVGGGSDGSTASAWVTKEAAVALKKQILEQAAPALKAKMEDLDIKEGNVYIKSDPGKRQA
jgi:CO/xanthine dehydrogenase Mo-binding subunit